MRKKISDHFFPLNWSRSELEAQDSISSHTSSLRHSNSNTSVNHGLALSRDNSLLGAVHIVPRSESRAPRRGASGSNELLDQQRGHVLLDRGDSGGISSHGGDLSALGEWRGREGGRLVGGSIGRWRGLFGHGKRNGINGERIG